jgi:hypothetical protein
MAIKTTGMEEFNEDINNLLRMVSSKEVVDAVDDGWSIVTDQMVTNIASFGTKGDLIDTGLMINNKSSLTNSGMTFNNGYPYTYAESGIFKSDSAMAVFGKNASKDIPAPLYAFWLEFGTQPHSLEIGDKAYNSKRSNSKSKDVNDSDQVTAGIPATNFISKAFDMKSEVAFDRIEYNLGKLMDKYLK